MHGVIKNMRRSSICLQKLDKNVSENIKWKTFNSLFNYMKANSVPEKVI